MPQERGTLLLLLPKRMELLNRLLITSFLPMLLRNVIIRRGAISNATPDARKPILIAKRVGQFGDCRGRLMDSTMQATLLFFDQHQAIYPLYECFHKELLPNFPKAKRKSKRLKSLTTIAASTPAFPSCE